MLQDGIVLVAVMIVVEVIKLTTDDSIKKYLPVIALLLGVAFQLIYSDITIDNVFQGILIGGAAAGVYDVATKTILDDKVE